jgi:hypothetical protein
MQCILKAYRIDQLNNNRAGFRRIATAQGITLVLS